MNLWKAFKKNKIGLCALGVLALFAFVGLYAPIFASSKPLLILYDGKLYSPLLSYLFYPGFFTKPIDLFYNVMMITLPITLLGLWFIKKMWRKLFVLAMVGTQVGLFLLFSTGLIKDPASDPSLATARQIALQKQGMETQDPLLVPLAPYPDWHFELGYMPPFAKVNLLLRHHQRQTQHTQSKTIRKLYFQERGKKMPTLWANDKHHLREEQTRLEKTLNTLRQEYAEQLPLYPEFLEAYRPLARELLIAQFDLDQAKKFRDHKSTPKSEERYTQAHQHLIQLTESSTPIRQALAKSRAAIQHFRDSSARMDYLTQRREWLKNQELRILIPPLVRSFHWEDDAGGEQSINKYTPWWELTRINRKDLVASLIFGVRVSLVIGITVVVLSLLIGIPLGMISGYFVGRTDLIISRWIEIWEAMPTFFMLLLIVAITQNKSLFLIMCVLGVFGWTTFGRFIRGEVLKQRNLPYVLASKSQGFRHGRIMFSHILPNAIPPILTLLPFSMMAAITSEAALSFLGLGEEGSSSWGVLMSEGRSVFPGESYLLWPPAICLTLLLIAIAIVGDVLRDAIDPRLRSG